MLGLEVSAQAAHLGGRVVTMCAGVADLEMLSILVDLEVAPGRGLVLALIAGVPVLVVVDGGGGGGGYHRLDVVAVVMLQDHAAHLCEGMSAMLWGENNFDTTLQAFFLKNLSQKFIQYIKREEEKKQQLLARTDLRGMKPH